MRLLVLALLTGGTVSAQNAVIRGVVVENLTSKPLARATVVLQPIAGTPGAVKQMKAGRTGAFVFDKLPAGTYVLKASRIGFMTVEYGQKRWNSSGTPVALADGAGEFLTLRLLRYSAITGTVVDENEVGLPDHDVVAYRNTKPPEVAAQGVTDDRGVYRLHGLEPGTYYVRTGGKRYDDEIYRPTYGREAEQMDQAHTVELVAEQDSEHADIRPFAGGRLNNLTVVASGFPPEAPVILTIASELGRKSVKSTSLRLTDLPPGYYDLYAEAADSNTGGGMLAAYQRVLLGRDQSVSLVAQPGSELAITGTPQDNAGKLWVRRRDLAGTLAAFQATVVRGRATIPSGRWEVMLQPPTGYYAADFAALGRQGGGGRADGWNEIVAGGYARFQFTAASGPAAIRGMVKGSGDGVAGAPVFLEGYEPESRTRIGELKAVRTDARGQYYFADLAPGVYRIVSTFEYAAPDVATMELMAAQALTITAHSETPAPLELYVIR